MKEQGTSDPSRKPRAGEAQGSQADAEAEAPGAVFTRAFSRPDLSRRDPDAALYLQRTIGNRATRSLLSLGGGGAGAGSLTVGPAGGALEAEADRAADLVMSRIEGSRGAGAAPPIEASDTPLARGVIQRSSAGLHEGTHVPGSITLGIHRMRGRGRPLGESTRSRMEGAFGVDLRGVRVHADHDADSLNRSLNARAFATGQDIFFRKGEFDPDSRGGQRLLAHELSHVVQQGGSPSAIQRVGLGQLPFADGYDKILQHPEWHDEAEAYERRLGSYCYNHPRAKAAASAALQRMHDVLSNHFIGKGKTEAEVAAAFLKDDTTSAGQIGTKDPEVKLQYLFNQGNLREQMTAFYNAAYYKAGISKDAGLSLKTILHDITIRGRRFDAATSNALGLDTDALRQQANFLRGNKRAMVEKAMKAKAPDKAYTVEKDIFALGNLTLQHSVGAVKEMVDSQKPRVSRSEAEKAHGARKKTNRDYAALDAPLSDAEKGFLSEAQRPLLISLAEVPLSDLGGTFTDPSTSSTLTLDADGTPHWEHRRESSERDDATGALKSRTFKETNDALGTEDELVLTYESAGPDAVGAPAITSITWRQFILHSEASRLADDVAGPELPLGWIEGGAWFTFSDADQEDGGESWYTSAHEDRGMPVVAGMSGTTTRMLLAAKWLNGVDLLDFRLAVMGWMLTSWDHSLYEILRGSEVAGIEGGDEDLTNVTQMYQNVPPLEKHELRAHVCKDGMFPHELIYMRMAREPDRDATLPSVNNQLGDWSKNEFATRLIEPGPTVINNATDTYSAVRELASNLDTYEAELAQWNALDPHAQLMTIMPILDDTSATNDAYEETKRRLEGVGVDAREVLKNLSEAQAVAIMGYTSGYHHILNSALNLPKPLALKSIRGKLNKRLRKRYLEAELALVRRRLNNGVATATDGARQAILVDKISRIEFSSAENEGFATLSLRAFEPLVAELAASQPGSDERTAKRTQLVALVDAVSERLYDEMKVQSNMALEGLASLPKAKGEVYRGDNKAGSRPRLKISVNDVYTFDTMASASRDLQVAYDFTRGYESPVVMVIELIGKGGRDISFLSSVPEEEEVLLMPGTRVRVTRVKNKTLLDKTYKFVYCTEI